MSPFKFAVINPLLHSELRLKIMVALDSLKSADFMYLCQITDSTRGNGIGRFSRTTCSITNKGREALQAYEKGLRRLFSEPVPDDMQEAEKKKQV